MRQSDGFTLIELVITIVLAAIVLTMGVPAFQGMMRNNRIVAHTNDFLGSLNLARNEAIRRGAGGRVVLCPGTEAGCSGTAWGSGWIVFVDADNNGAWDSGETILRVHEALSHNNTLTGDTNVSAYISFTANGSAQLTDNTSQTGILMFSLCNTQNQRNTIVINSVGRARVAPQTCP